MRSEWGKLRLMGKAAAALLLLSGMSMSGVRCAHAQIPDQMQQAPPPPFGMPGPQRNNPDNDPFARRQRQKQEQARNTQRQEQLVKDTSKLLELATELKTEVDKTNKDTLSVDVIKKAEEIEKLAHSVREKMRE